MTLVAAWIRKIQDTEELVVASDSRLRFGCAWDYCPKVFPLPRGDCVLCFAGDTFYAYPMLIQLRSAIGMNPKLASRAVDITDLRNYVIELIEEMRNQVYDYPTGADEDHKTDFRFIFAGYSWKEQRFLIWHLGYQKNIKKFSFRSVGRSLKDQSNGRAYHFIGDETKLARERLNRLLAKDKARKYGELDMEPLKILISMIKDKVSYKIGGPPQVLKVYKHMNTRPYNVFWPCRESGRLTFFGRPLLNYEVNDHHALDPESLEIIAPTIAFK